MNEKPTGIPFPVGDPVAPNEGEPFGGEWYGGTVIDQRHLVDVVGGSLFPAEPVFRAVVPVVTGKVVGSMEGEIAHPEGKVPVDFLVAAVQGEEGVVLQRELSQVEPEVRRCMEAGHPVAPP
jgi:hypothetical protein